MSVRCGCRAAARSTDGYGRRPYGPADLPVPQTLLSFHSRAVDLAMTGAGRRPGALGPGLSATGTSSAYDSAWARDRRLRTAACQSPRRDPRSGLGETVLAPALARRLVGAGHCSAQLCQRRSQPTALLICAVPRRSAERSGGSTNALCPWRRTHYNGIADLYAVQGA